MPATIRALSDAESRALLARNHVGRIAFTFRDRVDIEPIHFVYDDGWIYGRTSFGAKLSTLAHHPWCAFEVDEARGLFDWESVVVHGAFSLLDPELASPGPSERALALLRRLVPATLTADDPTPHRAVLFRIHASDVSGRGARA